MGEPLCRRLELNEIDSGTDLGGWLLGSVLKILSSPATLLINSASKIIHALNTKVFAYPSAVLGVSIFLITFAFKRLKFTFVSKISKYHVGFYIQRFVK